MSFHLGSTDRDLEGRIRNFFTRSTRESLQCLSVEATNGCVILQGRVSCFYERQLALGFCQRVAGVIEIEDQIEVDA